MRYFISVILPILLIFGGLAYAFYVQRKYYSRWYKELSFKQFSLFIFPTLIKSIIIFVLIIIIHNSFHNDEYVELTTLILLFFAFSIIQSAYSLSAFLSRSESLLYTVSNYYKDKGDKVDKFFNRLLDVVAGAGSTILKIVVIVGFFVVFIPNISLFITTNILYFILFVLFVGLSLIMNNILYFGLISLMIFQIEPVSMTFTDINYPVMILSYLVILIGLSLENRLETKMFFVINILEVKKLNFNLGYTQIKNNKSYVLYQNQVNQYYYIYFRQIGLVVVYYCEFKVELSSYVIRYMIKQGKRALLTSDYQVF
jgi:hypothetical protein